MTIEDEVLFSGKYRMKTLSCDSCDAPLYQGMCPVCHKDYTPEPIALDLRLKYNCMDEKTREYRRDLLFLKTFVDL